MALALMVHTTRFGDIEVDPEQVLAFPDGLIGLGGSEYALIPADNGPFIWLQSLSDAGIALPLTDPRRFFPDFALELDEEERERLGLEAGEQPEIFVTVRAAGTGADCTANLKAPIVVVANSGAGPRHAHQVINQHAGAALRTPLFPGA